MPVLLTNGYIHSTSDPYANALHAEKGVITWMGSEETAESMVQATAAEPVKPTDISGGLVTPAIIDAFTTHPVQDPADPRQAATVIQPNATEHNYFYAENTDVDATGIWVSQERLDQLASILESISAPTQLLIESAHATDLDHIIQALSKVNAQTLMRSRHRIKFNHPISADQLQALKTLNLSATIVPDHENGKLVVHVPAADLLSNGIHLVIGSGDYTGNFWDILTAFVEHPNEAQRISTRATFNAVSRDGYRILPAKISQQKMSDGRLAIGAEANLCVWHANQLGVQAPDVSAAHWSTDARAGTPLLPILNSTDTAPVLSAVIKSGEFSYQS